MKEFLKTNTVTHNLMSFTGFKSILIFTLLSEGPKTYAQLQGALRNHEYLKENVSLLDPVFILTLDDDGEWNTGYNYVVVDEWNRSFFITDITYMSENVLQIACHVDVLMSFHNSIFNLSTLIERQEFVYSPYIQDDEIPVQVPRMISKKNVGNVSEGVSFIIVVTGGQ